MRILLYILILASCQPKQLPEIQISSVEIQEVETESGDLEEVFVRREINVPTDFNNPGCIRPGNPDIDALAIGWAWTIDKTNGRFLVFGTIQDGFYAIEIWKNQNEVLTLSQGIHKYADTTQNNTEKYLDDFCRKTGATRNTRLKNINTPLFVSTIAEIEGYKERL